MAVKFLARALVCGPALPGASAFGAEYSYRARNRVYWPGGPGVTRVPRARAFYGRERLVSHATVMPVPTFARCGTSSPAADPGNPAGGSAARDTFGLLAIDVGHTWPFRDAAVRYRQDEEYQMPS